MQKNKVHEQLQLIKIIATVLVGPQILHIFSSICGKRVAQTLSFHNNCNTRTFLRLYSLKVIELDWMKQISKTGNAKIIWPRVLTEIVRLVYNYQQHVDLVKYTSETVQVTPVCYRPASAAILSIKTNVIT